MDNNRIKIMEAGNGLGLGGTEYVMQLYSKYLNKAHFEVLVIGIYEGGEREKLMREQGTAVRVLNGDMHQLALLLREADVFHWHGDGAVPTEIFEVLKANRPRMVIQTNVFGGYDYSPLYSLIDYDLFVSRMILVRRMWWDSTLPDHFAAKRKVLYNPVDTAHIRSLLPGDARVTAFKAAHGLSDAFITGRIGRRDDSKFDLIALEAFARFAEKVDQARFLLLGATGNMVAYAAELGIGHKLILPDTTPDLEQLLLYYSVMDVYLAASRIGESFGLVIAEAMCAGLPVIAVSTEDMDNAQIELVDNEKTGLVVARDAQQLAKALEFLYARPETRAEYGREAQRKVSLEYEAKAIVASLENLVFRHLGLPAPEPSGIQDYSREMVEEYNRRCGDLWAPAAPEREHL